MFKVFDKKTRGRRRKNALILENTYGDMMSEENKKITHAVAHYSSDKKCKKFIIQSVSISKYARGPAKIHPIIFSRYYITFQIR